MGTDWIRRQTDKDPLQLGQISCDAQIRILIGTTTLQCPRRVSSHVRLMHKRLEWDVVNTKTTRLLPELHLMWWMRLSKVKFMAGNTSVWEACVCGVGVAVYPQQFISDRLHFSPQSSASSPSSDNRMIPALLLQHTVKPTTWNLKLITSDGTTPTAPVLLKLEKQRDLWHPLSLWKVHVIVLHSGSAPKRHTPEGPSEGAKRCWMWK